ncbi:hypothetical protein ACQ4PT_059538 [Festuca glaucescens]
MDGLLDELLPVIVSFLPAHDAVRTCVLAKRWRHVWTSAPALRITAVKGFRSADQFNRFVDRLLLQRRQGLCPLESCEFNMVESDFEFDWSLCVEHVLPSLEKALVRIGEFTGDECDGSGSACCLNENPCWECRFAFEFDADRGRSYLFQGLSRASHLELSASYDHAFIFQRDLKWRPKFPMLKTLVLDDWCLDADLSAVILFIQQSPNLEKLTLELFEEFDSSMVSEGSNHLLPGASVPDHLKMVEIKCEIVDVRVNKVLKILNTYGISLDRIYIRQTDTNPGCSAFVCTGFNLN